MTTDETLKPEASYIFEADNDLISVRNEEKRFIATWEYNQKDKTIHFESIFSKKMNGVFTIEKLTKKELVYKNSEATVYLKRK